MRKNQAASQNERNFFLIICLFMAISLSLNVMDYRMTTDLSTGGNDVTPKSVDLFKRDGQNSEALEVSVEDVIDEGGGDTSPTHSIGGLTCSKYGGPSNEIASEMIYWQDIPSDAAFTSPFHNKAIGEPVQYLTFEPDGGGWNNIR